MEELNEIIADSKHVFISDKLAIKATSATFSYGRSKAIPVLQSVDLNVPNNIIYALLGPSGCGKTTLLKCLAGLISLDQGEITLYGKRPGTSDCLDIPGADLGYMPQDSALYDKFTVEEMIFMFGKLSSAESSVLRESYDKLESALKLPRRDQFIYQLSGGQKRRVSLACALIHHPRLLILDEPTVGADPVMRKIIWAYLARLTESRSATIIITTHYIEEAKLAHKVGMMRNGRILIEVAPLALMKELRATTLESCFTRICQDDNKSFHTFRDLTMSNDQVLIRSTQNGSAENDNITGEIGDCLGKSGRTSVSSKIVVLTQRNVTLLKRNLVHLAFEMVLPAVQVILFCVCVGGTPFDLGVGLVNDDSNSDSNLGYLFFNHLDDTIVRKRPLNDLNSAVQLVKAGKAVGLLYIERNFSQCLSTKIKNSPNVDNDTVQCSSISARMDFTDFMKTSFLKSSFFASYQSFLNDVYNRMGISVALAQPLVDFVEPIYGGFGVTFTEYLLPNVIVGGAYHMSLMTTAFAFITEKKSGTMERFLMSGVTFGQILTSHFLIELVVLVLDTIIMIIIPFWVFGFVVKGSLLLLMSLIVLQGLIGMTFGITIALMTSEESMALAIVNGLMYPAIFISGFFWPIEGMPSILRQISYLTNLTLPMEAFRSIITRGWGLTHVTVIYGFIVSFAWIAFNVFLTIIILRLKK